MRFLYLSGSSEEHICKGPEKRSMIEYFIRQDAYLKRFVKSHSRCYIYGAGNYARELVEFFETLDIKINGFVVSNMQDTDKEYLGYPVYELITLLKSRDKIGFFLGLSYKNTREVARILKEKGIKSEDVYGQLVIPFIESDESELVSFNVFDTLLVNKMATREGLFLEIQERLQSLRGEKEFPDFLIDNFFTLRVNAENLARANFCNDEIQEITLRQIYCALSITGGVSKACEEQLIELEEEVVKSNLCLVEENLHLLQELKKSSNVLLLAETYYSRELVDAVFEMVCPELLDYELVVTSVCKKNKETAAVYHLIRFYKNVLFPVWDHYGNDKVLDYEIPASLEITPHLISGEELFPFEQKLIALNIDKISFQKNIGISYAARAMDSQMDRNKRIGCAVGGPLFFSYVHWLLQRCEQEGIKRLYFVARDGYLLKKIADLMIQMEQREVSTHYIYGSRKAWRMATLSENNCDLEKFIANSSEIQIRTVKEIADIFQIPVELINEHISEIFNEKGYLDIDEYDFVRQLIFHNKDLEEKLIAYHASKRKMLREYLKQEIDFSDEHFAFVELSGSGFTQECISDVMAELTDFPVITFFQKLDWLCENKNCMNYGYIPSNIKDGFLIEVLCHALHGATEGYESIDGKITPVIDTLEQDALKEHGYEAFIEGTLLFVRKYLEFENSKDGTDDISVPILYLKYMVDESNDEIIDFIGDMPFSYSGRDKEVKYFAPALSVKDIDQIYKVRKREKKLIHLYHGYQFIENEPVEKYYKGGSLSFSLMRSTDEVRQYARICEQGTPEKKGGSNLFTNILRNHTFILVAASDLEDEKRTILVEHVKEAGKIIAIMEFSVAKSFGAFNRQEFEMIREADYDTVLFLTEKKEDAFKMLKEFIALGTKRNKLCWLCFDL